MKFYYICLLVWLRSAVLVEVGWSLGDAYSVTFTWQVDSENASTTAVLLLVAAYVSKICVLYGHICKTRVCVSVCVCVRANIHLHKPAVLFHRNIAE